MQRGPELTFTCTEIIFPFNVIISLYHIMYHDISIYIVRVYLTCILQFVIEKMQK